MPGTMTGGDLAVAIERIEAAQTFQDLFGSVSEPAAYLEAANREYRRLIRLVHPDVAQEPEAEKAAARLTYLYDQLQRRARAGALDALTLVTRRHEYVVGDLVARGDVANLYLGQRIDDPRQVIIKMVRSPKNNDLLDREVKALKRLDKADEKYRVYAPVLLDSFSHQDAAGVRRRVNVLPYLGEFYSLTQVRQAYPSGIDARDAAWMFRRLLIAIGWAQTVDLVHGAVTPDHVLIWPEEHGLMLVGWGASNIRAGKVPVVSSRWRGFYPPEIPDGQPATGASDIYMAARTLRYLLDAKAPRQIRAFIEGCSLSQRSRPQDAWELLAEFTDLIVRMWGPRRFREFAMPQTEGS